MICQKCLVEKTEFAFDKKSQICKKCKVMKMVIKGDKLRRKENLGLKGLNKNTSKVKILSKYIRPERIVAQDKAREIIEKINYRVIDEETIILMDFKNPEKEDILTRINTLERDKYTCQYCRANEANGVDHITPVSKGGVYTMKNLISSCDECNHIKDTKIFTTINRAREYIKQQKLERQIKEALFMKY